MEVALNKYHYIVDMIKDINGNETAFTHCIEDNGLVVEINLDDDKFVGDRFRRLIRVGCRFIIYPEPDDDSLFDFSKAIWYNA